MYPSSFYDLRARYIYTPFYGPYSLSEALEGLIFYTLNESRDSVSIGSKRTLWHELISELSNVIDDLQDYLVYFSSKFLISPLNSPDFIKELQAGHTRFEHLNVYWGAAVTRLVIACKIVEHNFWPHFFQLVIDNPADLQSHGRLSSVLPNAALDKLLAHTSALVSPLCTDSAPYSTYGLLEVQDQPFNARSPQTMPSKTDPTGGKEDGALSLTLNTTPSPSGSRLTQIPPDRQPSVTSLKSRFPQKHENRSDEVFPQPNRPSTIQRSCGSTSAYTSDAREPGNLQDKAEVRGANGQDTKEVEIVAEGEEVTTVSCTHSPPVRLTCILGNAARNLVTTPARMPSPSSTSWSTSMSPRPSSITRA